MVVGDTRVVRGTNTERRGRTSVPLLGASTPPPDPDPVFVLGTTMPTRAINGPRTALTPYSGIGAGGVFKVPQSHMIFENYDFGNTRIEFAAGVDDIIFRDCRQLLTANLFNKDLAMIDMRKGNPTNVLIEFCDIDTTAQGNGGMTGIYARNATIRRTNIRRFTDLVGCYMPTSAGGDLNLRLEGCRLEALSFYWNPTGGIVHSSDTKTHNDGIQHQGGTGLELVGNYIDAHYSNTVGTGTPNSGSEYVAGIPYTQAAGVAKRFEIVEGNGTYSAGQPGALLGGSIAALMFTGANRGSIFGNVITDNWIGGGAFSINAGDADNISPWGDVLRNRFFRDQRNAGWAIGIRSGVTANTGEGTANKNIWMDDGTQVTRKNA